MSWEWSHTGYENVRENLLELDKRTLDVIWAEWAANTVFGDEESFDEAKYDRALTRAAGFPADILANDIWENMSNQGLCTNGGHAAWSCPYGCGCHMVSFDREEEEEEIKV